MEKDVYYGSYGIEEDNNQSSLNSTFVATDYKGSASDAYYTSEPEWDIKERVKSDNVQNRG